MSDRRTRAIGLGGLVKNLCVVRNPNNDFDELALAERQVRGPHFPRKPDLVNRTPFQDMQNLEVIRDLFTVPVGEVAYLVLDIEQGAGELHTAITPNLS